ncbi:MAG TPA: gephyrin-like molybdotransferase Glp [Actinomycetota bacterium]|nr:gephyrin-like molybdotransferase Glp [Actinomycetota bacterium]
MKRLVTPEELRRPLVPYEEAVATILASFAALEPQRTPVAAALGSVAAETVVADLAVPGFDNSAMDGYAIRAADTAGAGDKPVTLRLIDDLPAGSDPTIPIEPGTAATIMTGAAVPPGCDAVVPWEDTEPGDGVVIVKRELDPGRNIRPKGEDLEEGREIVTAGGVLRPVHLGVLASIGRTHVLVHPRPRVAVLSTGDELVPPGGKLMGGQLFESNRTMIAALCEHDGARVVRDGLLPDDPEAIGEWMREAAGGADLIITSGGASVGEHDWIRDILEREGSLSMWRVAIKPGKPVALGRLAGTPVLALPGNPGSAFVGMHVFGLPALRIMAGRDPRPPRVEATLAAPVKGSPARTQFTRVRLDGDAAHPLPLQSSVVLSNLLGADGFAVVPPGGLPEGAAVTIELL